MDTAIAAGYEATKTDDALTIHNVPIFCTCARGDETFDERWISEAVSKAKLSESEGYYPPLHIRHHEPSTQVSDAVKACGYFRVLGTEPITFQGSRRTAVMADLVITCPETQVDILARRLPYRSIEIFDVDKPNIDGLALLDHEAPFLELPNLMVGAVKTSPGQSFTFQRRTRARPKNFAETDPDKVASATRKPLAGHDEKSLPTQTTVHEGINMNFENDYDEEKKKKPDEALKGDNDDEKKGEDFQEEGGLDISGVVSAIESGEISVADMDSILAAIQAVQSAKVEEAAPEEGAAAAPAPVPGGEAMRRSSVDTQVAALWGENESLKADINTMKLDARRNVEVAEAMQRLEGRPLGADLEDRLVSFHADHGVKAFHAYVDGLAKTTGVLPGDDGKAGMFQSQTGRVPEVAMKYQGKGTDAIDAAAKFARYWEDLSERGHTRMSQERYVDVNMAKAGS